MTNRISDPGQPPAVAAALPAVKAHLAHVWRCPDCGCVWVANRSSTHIEKCKRCAKWFTVQVQKQP